jgi:NAD(P)H dehydrogenase (quinone)
VSAARGNPYGTAHPGRTGVPDEKTLAAARYQGERLTTVAISLTKPV